MSETPYVAFALMRKMFVLTGGLSNDIANSIISKRRPKPAIEYPIRSLIGDFTSGTVDQIVADIAKNGYYVFSQHLSEKMIDRLRGFAETTKGTIRGADRRALHEEALHSGWPRFEFDMADIVASGEVCDLVTDPLFFAIAAKYLNCSPILDLLAFWWSYPSTHHLSEAAQMFHFDMDRFKFLKFFFYLTDVDLETGPHTYVEGSHRRLPITMRHDGRFSDQSIEKKYGADHVKRIVGRRGTVIAVDTRGFHKGEPLVKGERLLFQIEFANSLFGMNYASVPSERICKSHYERFAARPEVYLQIFE